MTDSTACQAKNILALSRPRLLNPALDPPMPDALSFRSQLKCLSSERPSMNTTTRSETPNAQHQGHVWTCEGPGSDALTGCLLYAEDEKVCFMTVLV